LMVVVCAGTGGRALLSFVFCLWQVQQVADLMTQNLTKADEREVLLTKLSTRTGATKRSSLLIRSSRVSVPCVWVCECVSAMCVCECHVCECVCAVCLCILCVSFCAAVFCMCVRRPSHSHHCPLLSSPRIRPAPHSCELLAPPLPFRAPIAPCSRPAHPLTSPPGLSTVCAEELNASAKVYEGRATTVRRAMCFRNYKLMCIVRLAHMRL
jgi:hypothetical protein